MLFQVCYLTITIMAVILLFSISINTAVRLKNVVVIVIDIYWVIVLAPFVHYHCHSYYCIYQYFRLPLLSLSLPLLMIPLVFSLLCPLLLSLLFCVTFFPCCCSCCIFSVFFLLVIFLLLLLHHCLLMMFHQPAPGMYVPVALLEPARRVVGALRTRSL